VSLSSRVGETELRAVLSDRMPVGVVYTTFHHPVTGANVVTTENSDWATNCPEYKVTAVQVGLRALAAPAQGSAHEEIPSRYWTEMAHLISPQVRMANEIAMQFHHRPADEAAAAIANHIRRFWDPRMKSELLNRAETDAGALDPLVIAAVRKLKA
jgi:hypothetical protein